MDVDGAASPSSSLSSSRSPSPLPVADPVTVVAALPGHLAVAIAIQKPGLHPPSSTGPSKRGLGCGRGARMSVSNIIPKEASFESTEMSPPCRRYNQPSVLPSKIKDTISLL
uniref:Uncharacterized protein n=1 Tax=Oryza brachyantha TaxID=4533 RepID=J3LKW7_ORYBR